MEINTLLAMFGLLPKRPTLLVPERVRVAAKQAVDGIAAPLAIVGREHLRSLQSGIPGWERCGPTAVYSKLDHITARLFAGSDSDMLTEVARSVSIWWCKTDRVDGLGCPSAGVLEWIAAMNGDDLQRLMWWCMGHIRAGETKRPVPSHVISNPLADPAVQFALTTVRPTRPGLHIVDIVMQTGDYTVRHCGPLCMDTPGRVRTGRRRFHNRILNTSEDATVMGWARDRTTCTVLYGIHIANGDQFANAYVQI